MKKFMKLLTIGQVASEAGVGVETVRFCERKGLIGRPARKESGYRQFHPEVVRRIRFIRRAKELGFTLAEIDELLRLRVDPATTCADVRARAVEKISSVDGKIAELEGIRAALSRLAASCRGAGPAGECPILDALDREDT